MRKISIYVVMFLFIVFAGNTHAMELDLLGGIDVHGFISQGYMESDENNFLANDSSDGTFAFNEMGINFSKQMTDKLRLGLQVFSRDLGAVGNNEIVLDWAFADYRWKDWAGLRVGRIKAPHGLYNESRDVDALRTNIFLPQSVYPEINRDTMIAVNGAGVYGDVPAGPVGGFSYYLLAGTMDIENDMKYGAVRLANDDDILVVSDDFDFEEAYVAALEWQAPVSELPFVDGLRLKWTYRASKFTVPFEVTAVFATVPPFIPIPAGTPAELSPDDRHIQYVYSLEYTWEDLVVAFEYAQTRAKYNINIPGWFTYSQWQKDRGYYISAAYRINDWFETGAYYSRFMDNSDDKNGDSGLYDHSHMAFLHDYALSMRFDINEYWVAKLEGHYMSGSALCLRNDNKNSLGMVDLTRHWIMWAAKLSFSF